MARTANPTVPGAHNHLGPRPRADVDNTRTAINSVFGADAHVIEGLPIEVGHGALEIEAQLAAHVARIVRDQGEEAAGAMVERLEQNGRVRRQNLSRELLARGMI
jgi:hypothetical protein